MKRNVGKMLLALLSKVPLVLIVILTFLLGYGFKGLVTTAPRATDQEAQEEATEAQMWTCSMHPQIREPEPGQCRICGMDLVPVEPEPAPAPQPPAKAEGDKKYACAMMCVPPLPEPGECPICGMEMVEVDEEPGAVDLGPRSLTLSPAAQKLAEIQVAPVERRFVEAQVRMVGKLDYDETRLKYITAWVPGRLDRLYVDYTGVPVKEGEHLVYMYSPELLVAQVELLQAIETARELGAGASERVRQSAEALVEDAREKLRLWGLTREQIQQIEQRGKPTDHMTIYSPIGGIVIHKNANEGMYVETGTRIYTIADLSRLWLQLDAYESDLTWLRYGQEVEFQTEAYPGETFHGTIAFIDPVLSAATRTVKVRVNVENPDGRLKPQMFARAVARARIAEGGLIINPELAGKWISPMHPEIVKDEPGECDVCGMPLVRAETLGYASPDDLEAQPPLVIPASAPLITGKRAVVYVAVPDQPGAFQGLEITLGVRAGNHYVVRDGLEEGELVVVNGNFKIDSAMQIQAKSSMMAPEGGGPPPGHEHHGHEQPATPQEPSAEEDRPGAPSEAEKMEREGIPPAFTDQLEPVFSSYFAIQTALSQDTLEDAREAAGKFLENVSDVDMALLEGPAHEAWMKEGEGLRKSARTIAGEEDIEKARAGFAGLSESMLTIARRLGTGGLTVYHLRCPMAFDDRGADWLQKEKETANPYFGSAMFRCGTVQNVIEPSPASSSQGGAHD